MMQPAQLADVGAPQVRAVKKRFPIQVQTAIATHARRLRESGKVW